MFVLETVNKTRKLHLKRNCNLSLLIIMCSPCRDIRCGRENIYLSRTDKQKQNHFLPDFVPIGSSTDEERSASVLRVFEIPYGCRCRVL